MGCLLQCCPLVNRISNFHHEIGRLRQRRVVQADGRILACGEILKRVTVGGEILANRSRANRSLAEKSWADKPMFDRSWADILWAERSMADRP